MDFAGNKYAYISKNKIENFTNITKTKKEDKPKLKLKREKSVERFCDKDLDEQYSEEEEMDIISTSSLQNNLISKNENSKQISKPISKTYDISQKTGNSNMEYEHEVDSNVLTVKFEFLKEKVGYSTGDPYICKQCEAFLNQFSVLSPLENSEKCIWECEFCNFKNEIAIEAEEIPKTDCIDYFIQSKSQTDKNFKNSSYNDEEKVIFTFDTSGSMCVSEPVVGKHKFKGNANFESNMKELQKFGDNSDQHFGNTSKNVTYISRLQCLQAAIENNLENMKTLTPNV